MEHLRRNTDNDRLIYTIEKIRNNNAEILEKKTERLLDWVMSSFTGVLSSVVSACIVEIFISNRNMEWEIITIKCISFFVLWVIFWFICEKLMIPGAIKIMKEKKKDISAKTTIEYVELFNTEIMQKVAEINEIITVIEVTDISECKKMNFVIFLSKYKEVVDFFYEVFIVDKKKIRMKYEDGPSGTAKYFFNIYSIIAVIDTLLHVQEKSSILLEDESIKEIEYESLMENDFDYINKRLVEVVSFLKESKEGGKF